MVQQKMTKEQLDKLIALAEGDFGLVKEAFDKAKKANMEGNLIWILTYILLNTKSAIKRFYGL